MTQDIVFWTTACSIASRARATPISAWWFQSRRGTLVILNQPVKGGDALIPKVSYKPWGFVRSETSRRKIVFVV
jgi:hypothetical protein